MVKHFVEDSRKSGMDSLITIPMAGYVAADKNGAVKEDETAPSARWVKVEFSKKGPFTLEPDLKDGVAYDDEFVNFLVHHFKKADQGGVKFYSTDNEPSLWSSTHPRIHPQKLTYAEIVERTAGLARAILKVDPGATIFGPASYGWQEFLTLQEAPDSAENNKIYTTFLDYYLDSGGKRLLHVLDLHWYPEAQGGGDPKTGAGAKRITEGDNSPESIDARLQAPRSLWDPAYVEKSWITMYSTQKKPIQLLPWVKQKIDQRYPGTKLSFTEYDYGSGDHISGGLAQADVLGIFGKYGVFMSNFWGDLKTYNKAAFKLYRNYDGKNSCFGDTAVSAGTEDVIQTSVYAAKDSVKPGLLWVVALNKNQKDTVKGVIKIQGKAAYKTWEAYGFDGHSPEVKPLQKGKIEKGRFDYSLAPLSAVIFACQGTAPAHPVKE